jgi:hypothetical protein
MNINAQVITEHNQKHFEWIFIKHNKYLTLDYVFDKDDERILFVSGLKYKIHWKKSKYFKVYIHNIKEYERCIQVLELVYKGDIITYHREDIIEFFDKVNR